MKTLKERADEILNVNAYTEVPFTRINYIQKAKDLIKDLMARNAELEADNKQILKEACEWEERYVNLAGAYENSGNFTFDNKVSEESCSGNYVIELTPRQETLYRTKADEQGGVTLFGQLLDKGRWK